MAACQSGIRSGVSEQLLRLKDRYTEDLFGILRHTRGHFRDWCRVRRIAIRAHHAAGASAVDTWSPVPSILFAHTKNDISLFYYVLERRKLLNTHNEIKNILLVA